MEKHDDDIKRAFHAMTEVPFTDSLQAKILEQVQSAKQDGADRALPRSGRQGIRRRRNRLFPSWMAAASGLVAACLLVWVGWTVHRTGVIQNTTASHVVHTGNAVNAAYGLKRSTLKVERVWTGTTGNYPQRSVVFAKLNNQGPLPVRRRRVVGVLAFGASSAKNMLQTSNWMTFVNAPKSPVAPGKSVVWSFHPVGAPTDAHGALSENPTLSFFNSTLVSPTNADVVWKVSQSVIPAAVTASPRVHWKTGESVGVHVVLQNQTAKPVPVSKLLALVWFSPKGNANWTGANVIRFMNTISLPNQMKDIPAHGKVTVLFRNIAGPNAGFGHLVVQVAILER